MHLEMLSEHGEASLLPLLDQRCSHDVLSAALVVSGEKLHLFCLNSCLMFPLIVDKSGV